MQIWNSLIHSMHTYILLIETQETANLVSNFSHICVQTIFRYLSLLYYIFHSCIGKLKICYSDHAASLFLSVNFYGNMVVCPVLRLRWLYGVCEHAHVKRCISIILDFSHCSYSATEHNQSKEGRTYLTLVRKKQNSIWAVSVGQQMQRKLQVGVWLMETQPRPLTGSSDQQRSTAHIHPEKEKFNYVKHRKVITLNLRGTL